MTSSGNYLYSSVGTEWWPHRPKEETSFTCLWGQGYYLVYLYSIPHIGGSCLSLVQHSICNNGLNSGATNSSYGEIQLRRPSSTEYSGNVHNLRGSGSLAGHLRNESQQRLLRLFSFATSQLMYVETGLRLQTTGNIFGYLHKVPLLLNEQFLGVTGLHIVKLTRWPIS